NVFDVDAIQKIATKHKLPVVEDACQAHLAEWKGRRAGNFGATGCFSFQASKNLNSGEGGAILSADSDLIETCYAFHNNSRGRKRTGYDFRYSSRGVNLRMTEFQGALLVAQMSRVVEQAKTRGNNGHYLTSMLREIPGITPARHYDGCTRNAYHLYMFRYDPKQFAGLPRAKFIEALTAEGIPASAGYSPLNKEQFIIDTIRSPGFRAAYPADQVDRWAERTACPENDRLCEEAVWFTQNMLLGDRTSMEQIAAAVRKIRKHASELARI
ncbi:MAG: DegT/DnrJ/EryC1/StrS family aminotransferase, partial [bacterium]|nr:DegT/DnrJ/EryC1/StrS family aminotransferase [bacterium]